MKKNIKKGHELEFNFDIMAGWRSYFKDDTLKKACNFNVEILNINDVEIKALVDDKYTVSTMLMFECPGIMNCNCSEKYQCVHEAALYLYLENHKDLLKNNHREIEDIITTIGDKKLKKFILKEIKSNNQLKDNFLNAFGNSVDFEYYKNKLSDIFEHGKGRDFDLHGIYDLDVIVNDLIDFIFEDIGNILNSGDHEFAYELLCPIGDLLIKDIYLSYNVWYDVAEEFMRVCSPLIFSLYLSEEKLTKLDSYENYITNFVTEW